ncbi:MAG: glutamate/gamma-aminobutyrate family transporter YjeM [Sarcina sp.]
MHDSNLNRSDSLQENAILKEESIQTKKKYKITFWSFVAMIFMTVYSLGNGQQIYYQMGYAAITYVIIGVLLFFIPYTFMISEMSSAFSHKTGGIFSWMSETVGIRFSTIGAFLWYISAIIWWFSTSSIAITFSTMIYGKDISETWHLFGLSNTGTTALIGVVWFLIIVFFCRKGIKSIALLTNVSMLITIIMHILILGGGILVFILSGLHFAQPFDYTGIHSLFAGPNQSYDTTFAMFGFLVFAIFILGGMESSGGLIDKVHKPKKTVPKAMIFTGAIIAVLYIAIVVVSGMAINWKDTFSNPNVNLFNYGIYMVQQQFFDLGREFGMSPAASIALGEWVNRISTWFSFLALLNLPLILYSPIKQMFEGLPEGMLPKFVTKKNKHGMTANALYIQAAIIIIAMLAIGFGGNAANTVYNNLTFMVTITTSIPWAFIVFSYIKFKMNDNIKKEYTFFNKKLGIIVGSITLITLIFADTFSIIQPFVTHDIQKGLWIVSGPIIFGLLGFILAEVYLFKKKRAEKLALVD